MRAVIQRVSSAQVVVEQEKVSGIGSGLLLLISIEDADDEADLEWMAKKILQLRIFDDRNGVMNLSVKEVNGELLVVSQFTLHASTRKGNRPSYLRAAKPGLAVPLYEKFVEMLESASGRRAGRGIFGAQMEVSLVNDGPVTIIMDSKNKDF